MVQVGTSARNRSLADDLRGRDTSALADLLVTRPDLVVPPPTSLSDLAARAATAGSIRLALHRVDRVTLAVAWAVGSAASTDVAELARFLAADPDGYEETSGEAPVADVEAAVAELHRMALLWREGENYRAVRTLADVAKAIVPDPRPLSAQRVTPQLGPPREGLLVDRVAGQQGLAAVGQVREVLRSVSREPPGLTRDGVVAVRELTATATAWRCPESEAARWLELAWLAGLLGPSADGTEVRPTLAGEAWLTAPAAQAWSVLAAAWWFSDRDWTVFDEATGARAYVFGDSHVSPLAATLRREWFLAALAAADEHQAAVVNVAELLAERRPMVERIRIDRLVAAIVAEAELLGVTGRGVVSSFGVAVNATAAPLDPADPRAEEALAAVAADMLPPEIDSIVVQADLTIVAPGPLVPSLAAAIAAFAEVESTGGATVYRLSVSSVEGALDRGWSADRIVSVLAEASEVALPQPVEYLVRDTAARHGRIRVGDASAYVVTEDAAAADVVAGALAKAGIDASRIAPTVVVTRRAASAVVAAIRAAGVAATVTNPDGTAGGPVSDVLAPAPRPPAPLAELDPARAHALATVLCAAETPREDIDIPPAPEVPRMHPAQVQAALSRSLLAGARLWLWYADNAGMDSVYLVTPLHLAGGVFEALDAASAAPRKFALTRVIGVLAA